MSDQVTITQILGAVNRHRSRAFLVWFSVMLIVLAGFLPWPRKYGSEGKLCVQIGRIATGISPAGGSASVSVQGTRETEVRSVVEIINSRAVIESVVDEIGADRILASSFDGWIPKLSLPSFSRSSDDVLSAKQHHRLTRRGEDVCEDLKVEMVRAEAAHAGAMARPASLRQKQTANTLRLRQMNDAEVRSNQLRRDVDIARQELAIYSQRRGEAKAMSIMDKRGISEIVVARSPKLNVKHSSPKSSLVLPAGVVLGSLSALGACLFFERNHLRLTLNESEIEEVLELPVLVTLPRVSASRNVVN